jgi:hypothetical protein
VLWILLFGSLWGLGEIIIGGVLSAWNVPSSVWVSSFALFVLAVARGCLNLPGTSTAMGVIAALFKLANAAPFHCHLLGIVALGAAFDAAASLLVRDREKISLRQSLAGAAGAYGGFAFFAVIVTYVIRFRPWVDGGTAKVLDHIFVKGSLTALLAAALVPMGFILGVRGEVLALRRPRIAYPIALVAVLLVWIAGIFSA